MSDGQVHSKIGASSMYRWSACAGSVRLSVGIPSVTSAYAQKGTDVHSLVSAILTQQPIPKISLDEDEEEAVDLYVSLVRLESQDCDLLIEQKFDLSEIYPGLFGTADAVIFNPKTKLLRVYDYKHGKGIIVEVENNSQLKYYGLGALLSSKFPASDIELVIVQPRADHPDGPIRRHRFKSLDLVEFAADLHDFAAATDEPSAPLIPGDHCHFCPAAGMCPALRSKALEIAKNEFSPTLSYDPAVLSETLTKIDMLEGYAKSVRAFAYAEAQHGRCPPGWKLVQKRATRHWKENLEISKALAATFSMDEKIFFNAPSIKSPAQVEKLLTNEQRKIINDFTVSVSSGLTLVEDSDKRPAALAPPASEFKVISDDNDPTNLFN